MTYVFERIDSGRKKGLFLLLQNSWRNPLHAIVYWSIWNSLLQKQQVSQQTLLINLFRLYTNCSKMDEKHSNHTTQLLQRFCCIRRSGMVPRFEFFHSHITALYWKKSLKWEILDGTRSDFRSIWFYVFTIKLMLFGQSCVLPWFSCQVLIKRTTKRRGADEMSASVTWESNESKIWWGLAYFRFFVLEAEPLCW